MSTRPKITLRRTFYRKGVLRDEQRLLKGKLHGVQRTWHRNGQLAEESEYRHGLRHGWSRQWDAHGRLLGSYRLENGTGMHRSWYDNGQLNVEYSLVEGQFCGRSRRWLRDGTLITDEVLLFNREVTPSQYRRAAAKDPRLPELPPDFRKLKDQRSATEKRNYRLFTAWLLAKPNCREMRTWLKTEVPTKRTLGRFKQAAAAVEFGEKLYQAGAAKVLAADIYNNKRGDQFADCLLVQLPRAAGPRAAIRKVCAQLKQDDLGAFLPDHDSGESHLYISVSA
jgi:hypothetical protein